MTWKKLAFSEDAILHSDISETEGFVRKTGAGAYEAIKTNLDAIAGPTVNEDSGDGYAVGSRWVDVSNNEEYVCLDASVAAAVWGLTTSEDTGESNTASNVGTAGVGVFKQKSGVNLEFKKINAGSANIVIDDDTGNSEVDIDVSTNVFLVDGTRAMAGTLDMNDYLIDGVDDIRAYDSGGIMIKDHLGANRALLADKLNSCHYFYWPLDMSTNKITDLGAGSADTDAVRYDQVMLLDGTQAMAADINFAKHNADAMCIQPLASAPGTPAMAQMYYNTTDDHLYVYAS